MGVVERLMKHVVFHPKTRCWVWTSVISNIGYGRVKIARRIWSAHRAAFTAFVGPIPVGMNVLHSCDNMKCINPEHLRLGTQSENIKESWDKDRQIGRWGKNRVRRKRPLLVNAT